MIFMWIRIILYFGASLLSSCDMDFSKDQNNTIEETSKSSLEIIKIRKSLHIASFSQDLNKSYKDISGRWIMAKPLHDYNEINSSFFEHD